MVAFLQQLQTIFSGMPSFSCFETPSEFYFVPKGALKSENLNWANAILCYFIKVTFEESFLTFLGSILPAARFEPGTA